MSEPMQPQHERLAESLRSYGANYREFSRRFAAWLGLHSTDAEALIEILNAEERGAALTPARLGERISLTSGATTALVNRLEQAGHVLRTREHTDRRLVTLRSSTHIHRLADEFFGPLGTRVGRVMSQYPPELLKQFESLLGELRGAMEDQLNAPAPEPPTR
ncbi:DNA-binding MarR family transcriptional regulator [Allocatelliglobosispora scoriae]|uniref:DNA-binding MarR family transcriptional regulator n=1 Tax=Allocatelliglobosispora scoriae TaxID=643052 RepID=A0A841BIH6_9ACTN|nr:helix-turn-helix domain-containing protein [Allocatelliglobosispora scoriae]MBB5867128.1 DNA-binding MarR family transcriptional regulator [Allocatelliglobosispora scoriae]